jgi:hypothetical protein
MKDPRRPNLLIISPPFPCGSAPSIAESVGQAHIYLVRFPSHAWGCTQTTPSLPFAGSRAAASTTVFPIGRRRNLDLRRYNLPTPRRSSDKTPLKKVQAECQPSALHYQFPNCNVLNMPGRTTTSRIDRCWQASCGPVPPGWWFSASGLGSATKLSFAQARLNSWIPCFRPVHLGSTLPFRVEHVVQLLFAFPVLDL